MLEENNEVDESLLTLNKGVLLGENYERQTEVSS